MAHKPNQTLDNRQRMKEQLLTHFLEKPQTRAYRAYQSQHPELPSYQRLIQTFGSWQAIAREVWGVEEARQPKEWNWEASIRFIQTKYPERLTSTQYREQGKRTDNFLLMQKSYNIIKAGTPLVVRFGALEAVFKHGIEQRLSKR